MLLASLVMYIVCFVQVMAANRMQDMIQNLRDKNTKKNQSVTDGNSNNGDASAVSENKI